MNNIVIIQHSRAGFLACTITNHVTTIISKAEHSINRSFILTASRRVRGDMIELYKIINGVYDQECCNSVMLWDDAAQRHSCRVN